MKDEQETAKLLAKALKIGYSIDNIHFMNWNSVDWHLMSCGLPHITCVNNTISGEYGILILDEIVWEYFITVKDKKITVEVNKR